MEKEKLKSISDNLERITGCPLILHNQSEIMAIKRTIYSYIYNQKRLGMLYYDVFDAEMEIEDRLNNQENDEILIGLPIHKQDDCLAVFTKHGFGKKTKLDEFPVQGRGGKGVLIYKPTDTTGALVGATMVSDNDNILLIGGILNAWN